MELHGWKGHHKLFSSQAFLGEKKKPLIQEVMRIRSARGGQWIDPSAFLSAPVIEINDIIGWDDWSMIVLKDTGAQEVIVFLFFTGWWLGNSCGKRWEISLTRSSHFSRTDLTKSITKLKNYNTFSYSFFIKNCLQFKQI